VHFSKVLAALSHALDLTEGQPVGHSIRSCLIAMRIARELGLVAQARSALYYAVLLDEIVLHGDRCARCVHPRAE
jgi:hypothetical protein